MGMGAHIEGQIPGQELRLQIPVRPLFQQISGNAENKEGVTTAPESRRCIGSCPCWGQQNCEDHCPLHRLHRIYLRSGVNIPVSTMSDWMGEVADLFRPLADRLEARILAAYIDQSVLQ